MKSVIIILIISVVAVSCYKNGTTFYKTIDGFTQGTTYHIIFEQSDVNQSISNVSQEDIDSLLSCFDLSLSTYLPNSIISRINNNDTTVLVDDYFKIVFEKSYEVYNATDGAFDITVGPLVNLWGFGPDPGKETDTSKIDSLLQFVGMEKVKLSDKKIVKDFNGIFLDANAIAQGFSVDVICMYFEKKGISNYLVEIGGEIRSKGTKKNNEHWKVGIDKPYENNYFPGENLQVILQLEDCSLATSGNYRKFYEKDGMKYSHSIDPQKGYPVMNKLLSATIVAKDCMTADAYATACMIMGFKKSKEFIENHRELKAYFVYSGDSGEFKTWYSSGFEKLIWKEISE